MKGFIMTIEEALKIYDIWISYQGPLDKIRKIFTIIPPQFLPYPPKILDEALQLVEQYYADIGETRLANSIQSTRMYHLIGYNIHFDDEGHFSYRDDDEIDNHEILKTMENNLKMILESPELEKLKLNNLENAFNSWIETYSKY